MWDSSRGPMYSTLAGELPAKDNVMLWSVLVEDYGYDGDLPEEYKRYVEMEKVFHVDNKPIKYRGRAVLPPQIESDW